MEIRKYVDVLDECIYFILIWNTTGLIKLKKIKTSNKPEKLLHVVG